ncbi:MAG: hypothetical protein M3O84_02825 [Actinomycetota bacterium]|nr:hypothetical protein [Actinomycetota bacterium]
MALDQRPRVLGKRYSLRDRLERGTGEEIWRAHDDVLGREVAVTLAPADATTGVEELISAARLSDQCVERILDAGTDEEGRLYVVTEFVPGETLRQLIDREGPLPSERAAGIVAPVLTALQCGHRLGIAHGRVRPERVLLGRDGRVRLAGFGLGNASNATAEEDVLAAGSTLFEALTGRPPPPEDPAPSARSLRGGIPRELDETLRAVLASGGNGAARRRPEPTLEEFRSSLERFAGTPVGETHREEPKLARSPSFFRSWMLVPLLLAAAAGVAIVVGLALGRLEVGGPLGIEPNGGPSVTPTPATERLQIRSATSYDPYGDGTEGDSSTPLAIDVDPATAWRTENYFDGVLNKPGVGLLLDLGGERSVTGVRLTALDPGFRFQIGVGDTAEEARRAAQGSYVAGRDERIQLSPATGRYVLVWVTSVVPTADGNRADVSEVEVVGSRG